MRGTGPSSIKQSQVRMDSESNRSAMDVIKRGIGRIGAKIPAMLLLSAMSPGRVSLTFAPRPGYWQRGFVMGTWPVLVAAFRLAGLTAVFFGTVWLVTPIQARAQDGQCSIEFVSDHFAVSQK